MLSVLSYLHSRLVIKFQFDMEYVRHNAVVPPDVAARALKKMEKLKEEGGVESFEVHGDLLSKLWQRLRDRITIEPNPVLIDREEVDFIIAEGYPSLPGLIIKKSDAANPGGVVKVTINAHPDVVKTWHPEWVRRRIKKLLAVYGADHIKPNLGEIEALTYRAGLGVVISNTPVSPLSDTQLASLRAKSSTLCLAANRRKGEVYLIVPSYETLTREAIDDFAAKFGEDKGGYGDSLGSRLIPSIKRAVERVKENFELKRLFDTSIPDLDRIFLVGFTKNYPSEAAAPARRPAGLGGAGRRLEVQVSEDQMQAVVSEFDMDIYSDTVSVEAWLDAEVNRLGLRRDEERLSVIKKYIRERKTLRGLIIAEGRRGTPGVDPFLHALSKEERHAMRMGGVERMRYSFKDIAEFQPTLICQAGDLVAEVQYRIPPVMTIDVYGKQTIPASSDSISFEPGHGIERRDDGKYYATRDGSLSIDHKKKVISIDEILTLTGDVGIRGGNVSTDGNVVIHGNVSPGVTIQSGGDIVIYGAVYGGRIVAKGSIEVHEGVRVEGGAGSLHARGSIKAKFIENATVICEGSLHVEKALIASRVYVGGNVYMEKDALITKGTIDCRGNLLGGHVGQDTGGETEIRLGVDWRAVRSIEIKTARFRRVQEKLKKARSFLKTIHVQDEAEKATRGLENEITRAKKRRALLKGKIHEEEKRLLVISNRLRETIRLLEARLTYYKSYAAIDGKLAKNVVLSIAGRQISIGAHSVAHVLVTARKFRGAQVNQLELKELIVAEHEIDGSPIAPPAASAA